MSKNQWLSSTQPPPDGTWCWVTDGKSVWPAIRHEHAKNGWSNEDTWEDFDMKVIGWIEIPMPAPPEQLT